MKQIEQVNRAIDSFFDSEKNRYYVPLEGSRFNYSKLTNSLNNQFKIILLFGPPGSGKSFLFQKFYDEYKEKYQMALYKTPTFDKTALSMIYEKVTNEHLDPNRSLNLILASFRENIKEDIIIMLDEAQLYTPDEMEWIRILSNEPNLKFIISVHKVTDEELLAQQHFQTRIFETIEVGNLTLKNMKNYIEQKIMLSEADMFLSYFSNSVYKLILKITKGNLRQTNRLLHRFFTLCKYQLENSQMLPIKSTKKYIEMAALDLNMLNKKSWLTRWFS